MERKKGSGVVFGRVVDQRWIVTSTGTALDRFQYGYDQDGNVLYKNNLANSSFSGNRPLKTRCGA